MVAILRGFLFVPAGTVALGVAATIGYFGANAVLVLLTAGLAPAAVVCWAMASVGPGGDRWTVGYVVAWGWVILVMPGILGFLGVLV